MHAKPHVQFSSCFINVVLNLRSAVSAPLPLYATKHSYSPGGLNYKLFINHLTISVSFNFTKEGLTLQFFILCNTRASSAPVMRRNPAG